MPSAEAHRVDPDDEFRHPPGPEELWGESWYADFVAGDGSWGGYVRLGLYPNLGVSWWTATVVGPGRPLVAATAYQLPSPEHGEIGVRVGDWAVHCDPEDPLAGWRVRADTPAAVHRRPEDVYGGEPGEPTALALDLHFSTDGVPFHYLLTTRYEIPCLVEGAVVVGGERLEVRGQGQRDHSWGVRDWWDMSWCWASARLDDGTRVHAADIRLDGGKVAFGYVQHGGRTEAVTSLAVDEELGDHLLPRSATVEVQPGGLSLTVEPLAWGPLLLTATDGRVSRFPRALMAVTAADGRRGAGWVEWNQPPSVLAAHGAG